MIKKSILGLVAVLVLLAFGLFLAREPISLKLVEIIASERMSDPLADLPDALHIGLCGTGSPFPDPERSAPCNVVVAGQQVLLFDSGSGTPRQLARMKLSSGL
ncbi:MAG: hypothetical protein R3194_08985, partial [Limnobacter sp.]|nr:hypothetical protein [Limnobacter sp.]